MLSNPVKGAFLFIILISSYKLSYAQNIFPENGNVGIGTTTPNVPLDVRGEIKSNVLSLNEHSTPIGYVGRGLAITSGWSHSPNIFTLTYQNRDFAIGGWSKSNGSWMGPSLYINSDNGNVGLGTTDPQKKLEVNGEINASGYYIKNSGTLDYPGSFLHRLRAEDGNFYIDGDVGGSTYNPAFTVHRLGNIGIGTTDTKGYKLAVNGTIRAHEIKVETAGWPDYVFKKSYPLPTLNDTEKHINEKGHLPGIPSAEEVKTNGIDLGEMNAKLLQKIEELTLHLIQQNKQILLQEKVNQEQQKTNQVQQEQNKQLQYQINSIITLLNKK